MDKINNGGAAFPRPYSRTEEDREFPVFYSAQEGMTLRDWFAGQALQGYLASWPAESSMGNPTVIACTAYEFADAMIAARDTEASK